MFVRLPANTLFSSVKCSRPRLLPRLPHPACLRLLPFVGYPPPLDHLKINFDAAVQDSGCSSGLVVRGSYGHVLLAVGVQHQGISDPYIAELLAAREAISLATSRSLARVIFEGDAEVVIRELKLGVVEDSSGGPLLRDCRFLLQSFPHCIDCRAVPRTANWAAHRVARKALLLPRLELASFDFVGWLASGIGRDCG
ncbi:unnamed protein product [Linum trigynum]|uniref:RNase H type-1 domain-containing protein n=1 Tax=Linum trigynum TaxID=586398 RepID=A0AAV2CNN1_9ROSI